MELRSKVKQCEFREISNRLLKVCGLQDYALRERILQEPENIDSIQMYVRNSGKFKHTRNEEDKIADTSKHEDRKHYWINKCTYCSTSHNKSNCPAYNKNCRKCGKHGHFAKMCKSKNKNPCNMNTHARSHHAYEPHHMDAILKKNVNTLQQNKWLTELYINDTKTNFKIDTGSKLNVIPMKLYKSIKPAPEITKTQIKLSAYNNTNILIIRKFTLTLRNKKVNITAQLVIAKTNSNAISNVDRAERLKLIKRISTVEATTITDLLKQYKDCFGEIGKLPYTNHITIDPMVKPIINLPQNVPFRMKHKLKKRTGQND